MTIEIAKTPKPCLCGDPAIIEWHDGRYWVSCSCSDQGFYGHDDYGFGDYPEVGGYEGFETEQEAVRAWDELMASRAG